MTFAQDVIEKYTLLNEPKIEYIIPDPELVDKNLMIQPKTRRTIVEIMKKYNDNI
jgi:5'(3')-deoxyribonucleotidase